MSAGSGSARGKGEQVYSGDGVRETYNDLLTCTDYLCGVYVASAENSVCGTVTVTVQITIPAA